MTNLEPISDDSLNYADALAREYASQLRHLQRSDLFTFTWGAFDVLHAERGIPFLENWHVEALCHHLSRVATRDCKRLLITIPPRHMKTICASVALPAFLLGHNPATKIIIVSYGQDLAGGILSQLRRVMQSAFYRRLFPETAVRVSGLELTTTKGGSVKLTSVGGGGVTGYGADYIIIDDLMKAADAELAVERDKAKNFIRNSLLSRFDSKKDGCVIAIQQRLHEDDVAACLLETGRYVHLNLPAIAESDERIEIGPNRYHRRRKGEALFPQSQPLDLLEETRLEMSPYYFSAQFQQNPKPLGGNRIDWGLWHTYDEAPRRRELQLVVQSWDTGMTAEPTSDYSACSTWGYLNRDWYLLDVFRQRLDYGDLKRRVIAMKDQWKADQVIIEAAATGIPLLNELRRENRVSGLVPYQPITDKQLRFETQISRLENGRFLLPAEAPWLAEFKHECQVFPAGKYDDMVDSLTQFLAYLGSRRGLGRVREINDPGWRPYGR